MRKEERPPDTEYYEPIRIELLSQGDLFEDVPRTYAALAEELVVDGPEGGRRFLSGPLEPGFALLVTPSCSMGGDNPKKTYDHKVRTLVPIEPLERLIKAGVFTANQVRLAERYDALINYMYLPAHKPSGMPASMALLYMPVTLDHDLLMEASTRIAQLTLTGAQQLQRKLVYFCSGVLLNRGEFRPPRD